ncbi:MAG: IS66 family transposase [Gemmatimonadota bacterium]|nr:MAG: IS66 family transposase [Gemmatimonadota bacterium]
MKTAVRKEIEDLEKKNAALREQVQSLEHENQRLQKHLRLLLHQHYGRRSEKRAADQLELFLDEAVAEAREAVAVQFGPAGDAAAPKRRSRRNGRKPLPKHLRRERIELDVPAEDKTCAGCGEARVPIGEARTEQLEVIPAIFLVKEFVRPKYACRTPGCTGGVAMADLPPQPIEKGRPGPGLLAHVAVSKYADHLPLYRQSRIFARSGVEINRTTLCDWTDAVGELLRPIVQAMRRRLLGGHYLQADETPIRVQRVKPHGTHRAYLWGYGPPWGEVVYDFSLDRSRANPKRFLEGFQGVLQVDAYGGFNAVCRSQDVVRVGCFAHVRRKFVEAERDAPKDTRMALALIQQLYRIEQDLKEIGAEPSARARTRRKQAKPLLQALKTMLDRWGKTALPKSPFGEAVAYARNQWPDLVRYVDLGQVEIDNNSIEHTMRPVALGRKNYLFAGSPAGGEKAAVLYSLVTSCIRLGIDPCEYLKDVIDRVSTHPMRRVDELTPRGWKQAQTRGGHDTPGE